MSEGISHLQIHPEDLQFRVEAKDWENALKVAATPLVKRDAITPVYIDEMIAAIPSLDLTLFLLLVLHLVILALVMQFIRQQFQLQRLHSQSSLAVSTMIL